MYLPSIEINCVYLSFKIVSAFFRCNIGSPHSTPRAETLSAYITHNETLGSSPSGRGFRAKANYYITEEDLVAIAINGP